MTDPTFTQIIEWAKIEAKGDAPPAVTAWLNDPANWSTWAAALEAAVDDADKQIHNAQVRLARLADDARAGLIAADFYAAQSATHEMWLKKVSRYRLGMNERRRHVRAAIDTAVRSDRADLIAAIDAHRSATIAAGHPGDDRDRALWAHVPAIPDPDNEQEHHP